MLEIISAEYAGGCRLRVCSSNGDEGTVDLTDSLWGAVFEPLRDPAAFKRFEVSPVLHTVRWENDADLAPEFLYEKMLEQRDGPDRRSRADVQEQCSQAQPSTSGHRGGRGR